MCASNKLVTNMQYTSDLYIQEIQTFQSHGNINV